MIDYEFYETPEAFTHWLFDMINIEGRLFEPCVGSGAIVRASSVDHWFTNDLDPRWPADVHKDATDRTLWEAHEVDWTVSNTPFTPAIDILTHAIRYSRMGVAAHLRASIHEVLKTGVRRIWMGDHVPSGILWLPRFAYQRSRAKGIWSTDSVCACWCVWLKDPSAPQFIRYAPESVLDALEAETPRYRERMDTLNGLTGSERDRQEQWKARWADVAA